jgi:hypothetical protein
MRPDLSRHERNVLLGVGPNSRQRAGREKTARVLDERPPADPTDLADEYLYRAIVASFPLNEEPLKRPSGMALRTARSAGMAQDREASSVGRA